MKNKMHRFLFIGIVFTLLIMAVFSSCEDDEPSGIGKELVVTFDAMNGFAVDTIIVTGGEISNEVATVEAIKIGYTFEGWYYDIDCTSAFNPNNPIMEDLTLFAKWKDDIIGDKTEIIKSLDTWLNSSTREIISSQSFAKTPLSNEDAIMAKELIVRDGKNQILRKYAKSWTDKEIIIGDHKMKLKYKRRSADRSLFISLHGGGGTTANVNDGQWANQFNMYGQSKGLYVAPRAPEDAFNMWSKSYMDAFYDAIIQTAVVMEDVDPNKVYLTGYSAGGDGVYNMAPRMADRWAAAAMCAGHPGGAKANNLRNIGFTIWVGANDGAYQRNTRAEEWGIKLDQLSNTYPGEYIHSVNVVSGKGHWMDNAENESIPWMEKFTRNPLPANISWRQDRVQDGWQSSFYWLSVNSTLTGNPELVVERDGNVFNVVKSDYPTFNIGINDDMIDYDQKVQVTFNGEVLFDAKVNRTIESIYNSMNARYDSNFVFSSYISVTVP